MQDVGKPGPGTAECVHIKKDGSRDSIPRPDLELNEAIPTCDEHDKDMELARLDENPETMHQLGFKCPKNSCHRITWLE